MTATQVTVHVDVNREPATVDSVFAELSGANDTVVMLGGHLDSVLAGPGINDNGSGVSTLLAMAEAVADGPRPASTVRFAFWAAEEFGDIGSQQYVQACRRRSGFTSRPTSTSTWSPRRTPACSSTTTRKLPTILRSQSAADRRARRARSPVLPNRHRRRVRPLCSSRPEFRWAASSRASRRCQPRKLSSSAESQDSPPTRAITCPATRAPTPTQALP